MNLELELNAADHLYAATLSPISTSAGFLIPNANGELLEDQHFNGCIHIAGDAVFLQHHGDRCPVSTTGSLRSNK